MRLALRAPVVTAAAVALTITLSSCSSQSKESGAAGKTEGNSAAGSTVSGDCPETFRMSASVAIAVGMAGLQLGNDTGIFGKHCIEMTETDVTAPPTALSAVLGGSADVTYLPINSLLSVMSSGIDVKALAPDFSVPAEANKDNFAEHSGFGIYLQKGKTISSAADLAGQSVAVPGRATIAEMGTAAAVDAEGGDPGSIKWTVLDPPTMIQQLEAGKIDAAVLPQPFSIELEAKGYERAVSPEYYLFAAGANTTLWVTSAKALDAKPKAFAAFAEAMKEINAYAVSHQDEVTKVISERTKTPLELAKAAPDFYVVDDMSVKRDVQPLAELLVKLGYIKSVPDTTDLMPDLG